MGCFFSIENPLTSLLWSLKEFVALRKMPGVKFLQMDLCMFGSQHKKPTGLMVFAPWIQSKVCSQLVPHRHVPLVGKVHLHGDVTKEQVWYTGLAAEYPEEFCFKLAKGFLDHITSSTAPTNQIDLPKAAEEVQVDSAYHNTFLRGRPISCKSTREKEAERYPGGLRNPNRAVALSQSLRCTGGRVRAVLARLSEQPAYRQEICEVARALGTKEATGFSSSIIEDLRQHLYKEFGITAGEANNTSTRFDVGLWKALLSAAEDPDAADLPDWLANGCPTGIGDSVIRANGVFPPSEGISASIRAAQDCAQLRAAQDWRHADHRNYTSFYIAEGSHAKVEIDRIAAKGFIETFSTWDDVIARWPKAIASKVALLLKERDDGSTKIRAIIDLRRSGGNAEVVLPERVVLPRLSDLVNSALDLMVVENVSDDIGFDLAVVDFEDAFHTLAIKEEDRGVMAIRTLDGWAVFRRLCCGMAAAPLVWCRVGSAAARLGQAVYRPEELRMQVFVDDPAIVTRGSPATRSWLLGTLLLFWTVLGFAFNWAKAHRGASVPWIGAHIPSSSRTASG